MIKKAYAVLDLKAGVYSTPFFEVTDAVAVRVFEISVNDKRTVLNSNPEDFVLHCIGRFDDNLGVLFSDKPEPLSTAVSVKRVEAVVNDLTPVVRRLEKDYAALLEFVNANVKVVTEAN